MSLFFKPAASDECCCPAMTGPACPPADCPSPEVGPPEAGKYFREVGAEMIGNRLLIRMEKDRSGPRARRRDGWEPPCDCDVVEIKRPNREHGPQIVNAGDNNQILFRIHSKAHLNKEDPGYKPQAIAYKVNRSGPEHDRSRKITIYPHLDGPVSQEVYTDHVSQAEHEVYLLRVKKKNAAAEGGKRRNLEVELRTPKPPPASPPTPAQPCQSEQPEPTPENDSAEDNGPKKTGKNGKKKRKKK